MFKKISLSLLFVSLLEAQNFQAFLQQRESGFLQEQKDFQIYKAKEQKLFDSYVKEQNKAFNEYKKELQKYWKKPLLTDKKRLVSYSKDKKSRTIIDFKKQQLKIQVIAKDKSKANQKMKLALAKAVVYNTKDFEQNDDLEQKLKQIEKKKGFVMAKADSTPVLAPIIFKKKPKKKEVYLYVNKTIKTIPIQQQKSKKIKGKKVYTLTINLPKDTTYKRSINYYKEVKKASQKEQLPASLIFAIMHSESSFNPLARSYVPAFGLMQIVPKTAGIDAYYYLYKQKRLVGSSYLYNAQNNIKMGSAYLHIIYYSYLKEIKNPQSRLYCTIAAYNTGAGNVARAFVHSTNRHRASLVINQLTPQEVYEKLMQNLTYDEPKVYLKRVSRRMSVYQKIYVNI